MNKQTDIRTPSDYQILSKIKNKAINFSVDPDTLSKTVIRYIKAMIEMLTWIIISLASMAAACIVLSGIWAVVKLSLKLFF